MPGLRLRARKHTKGQTYQPPAVALGSERQPGTDLYTETWTGTDHTRSSYGLICFLFLYPKNIAVNPDLWDSDAFKSL